MLTFDYISSSYTGHLNNFQFGSFDENTIKEFLLTKALYFHELQTATTRLYFDEDQNLVGFFTLHNDLIELERNKVNEFGDKYGWELPNDEQYYFPAIKLHYFAIDKRYRGLGYGKHLMQEIIEIATDVTQQSGCNFITIEALPNSVEFYHKRGFKAVSQTSEFTIMVFKLGEIEKVFVEDQFEVDETTRIMMRDKLIIAKDQLGYTHLELANRVGVDEEVIENFEFSASAPDMKLIKRIAEALNIELAQLY